MMKKLKNFSRKIARAVAETFKNGELPRSLEILPPLARNRRKPEPLAPHAKRRIAVRAALESAPENLTYMELQEYVREQTGTACRRETIAQWKLLKRKTENFYQ